MTPLQKLSVEQLQKLVAIREQIETLQGEIEAIAGGEEAAAPEKASVDDETPDRGQGRGVYKRSAAMRARMAAAQRARWAGVKAGASKAAPKKKSKFSAAHRAALAAAQKARWAKVRAGKTEATDARQRNDGE